MHNLLYYTVNSYTFNIKVFNHLTLIKNNSNRILITHNLLPLLHQTFLSYLLRLGLQEQYRQQKINAFVKFIINLQKPNLMAVQVKQLKEVLQNAHKGFAYELLALQIQVQSSKDLKSQSLIQNLSKLIQLYMLGVEVLQSNWDNRYKYFNDKIQGLMKKKHIIQQLHIASTGDRNIPKNALIEADKQMRTNRKNEHEINLFINQQHCNIKRVKEIVRKQQVKISIFKQRLKNSIDTQQKNISERIKMRKMKSECYSSRKFDIGSNPPNQKMKQFMEENDDIFDKQKQLTNNLIKKIRSNSGEKKKQPIIKV